MTKAPERIWCTPLETVNNEPSWIDQIEVSHPDSFCCHDETGTEYTRSDLHADLIKAADGVESWLIAVLDMHGLSYTNATAALTAYQQAKEKL